MSLSPNRRPHKVMFVACAIFFHNCFFALHAKVHTAPRPPCVSTFHLSRTSLTSPSTRLKSLPLFWQRQPILAASLLTAAATRRIRVVGHSFYKHMKLANVYFTTPSPMVLTHSDVCCTCNLLSQLFLCPSCQGPHRRTSTLPEHLPPKPYLTLQPFNSSEVFAFVLAKAADTCCVATHGSRYLAN